jgi:rRNA maturation RNase YbeY
LAVELRCESAPGLRLSRALKRDAARLMEAADLGACELSLMLVGDQAIRRLNRQFRKKDTPTDVLAFSQLEEPGVPSRSWARVANRRATVLGDVVISVDTAVRQARRLGVAPAARLRTLLIHGFLHLIGYDHERSKREASRMRAREMRLAAALARTAAGPGSAVRKAAR